MSRSASDLNGPSSSNGSTPSKKWRRRQCIEDLLASCSVEVLKLERGAAREVAASEHAVRLISARSSAQSAAPSLEISSSSSSPAPSPVLQPSLLLTGGGSSSSSPGADMMARPPSSAVETKPVPKSKGAAEAKEPVQSENGAERHGYDRGGSASAIATELLRVLARENTVLECNIHDYDVALTATVEEVARLKTEVQQLDSACCQIGHLRELLKSETRACTDLRHQNAWLATRRSNLITAMRQAAEVSDSEGSFLIDGLISQNTALRRLLSTVEAGSSKSSSTARRLEELQKCEALDLQRLGESEQLQKLLPTEGVSQELQALWSGEKDASFVHRNDNSEDSLQLTETPLNACANSGDAASSTLADRSADVLAEEIRAPRV